MIKERRVYKSCFFLLLMPEQTNLIIQLREQLAKEGNSKLAENYKKYLKSPYAFYGIRVPRLRQIAKEYKNLDFYSALNLFDELWQSNNHEEMSLALFLLSFYTNKHGNEIWKFLLERAERAKSWDHIDELSAHTLGKILASNLSLMPEIKKMAESKNLWIRRTSIVSTCHLIKQNKLELTFLLVEKLVYDEDIYVQKAAGWMLREAGKRNRLVVRDFILRHLKMKNFAFSYATEKMKELRQIRKEQQEKEKAKK